MQKSWADTMSEEDAKGPVDEEATHDAFDALLVGFPHPGELWVHMRSQCNYFSSLLALYPPPKEHSAPYMVNSWHHLHGVSPYRVTYGAKNPVVNGIVLARNCVVPNFSWTPCLAATEENMTELLARSEPSDLVFMPSVCGELVRVFFVDGQWYVATEHKMEAIASNGLLVETLHHCIHAHCKQGLARFVGDLRTDRVWFLALFPSVPTAMHVGTCKLLPHGDTFNDFREPVDLDFSTHRFLSPSLPILPGAASAGTSASAYNPETFEYTSPFNGFMFVNPSTLFAVRVASTEMVYLDPLLSGKQTMTEFLAKRCVEANLMSASRMQMDRVTYRWWKETVPQLTERFFTAYHAPLLDHIGHQINSMPHWIFTWMNYVSSLCVEEWNLLHHDLQRLYVVLDYTNEDDAGAWIRVVCNPKNSEWVARLVVFTLQQCTIV
jgi:hypothetical protein